MEFLQRVPVVFLPKIQWFVARLMQRVNNCVSGRTGIAHLARPVSPNAVAACSLADLARLSDG